MSHNIYTNPKSSDAMSDYIRCKNKHMFDYLETLTTEDLEDFMDGFTTSVESNPLKLDDAAKILYRLIKQKYEEIKERI